MSSLAARQQNVTVATITATQVNNEDGNNVGLPKDSDLPPAYDDVMKTYLNAKLQLQAEEEGAVGGMTAGSSTVTIETDIMTSTNDLSTAVAVDAPPPTTMTITTPTTTITCQEPPSYESTFSNGSNTRDSIV